MAGKIIGALTKNFPHINFSRVLIYCAGMVVLAVGLTLNTKAGLGVTPVLSIPFCSAQIFGISFGDAILIFYVLYVFMQLAMRKMKSWRYDWMQLPLSLAFSRLMNLLGWGISYDSGLHSFTLNFIVLLISIALTGIGASMTLNMRLIPNPADGAVQAVADETGMKTGTAKNIFDLCCICITIGLCLISGKGLIGLHVGTVVSVIGVGRAIAVTDRIWRDKMLRAAGMDAAR